MNIEANKTIAIKEISSLMPEAKELFRLLDEHNLSHCPPTACHLTQPEEMKTIDSTLLAVFYDGMLVGMGGLKYFTDYAEVTRMFTLAAYRGKGLATMLLKELELYAGKRKLKTLKLETNEKFLSAVKLYEKLGFERCQPFGTYVQKDVNAYYQKLIGL